jgi:hypothetical protein
MRLLFAEQIMTPTALERAKAILGGASLEEFANWANEHRHDWLRERGMLTMPETARRCGVSTKTISEWRQRGRICARAINDRNHFLFEDPRPKLPRKHARRFRALVNLSERSSKGA